MTNHTSPKGMSLAKGPIAILGLIGIIYGLGGLIFASHAFALHIPHGTVHGTHWIGLLVNGWTELLFIAAGLALLLFSPLHWGAKTMAMVVGLVLIAAAVIAIIRGNGVFGIFAANHLTELVWAAAGVLLLVLALLPRVGGRRRGAERSGYLARPIDISEGRRVAREPDAVATGPEEEAQPRRPAGASRIDNTHDR